MFDILTRHGSSVADDYEIEKSLRFNADDDTYFSRTPSSEGNRKTWTLSFWMKLTGKLDEVRQIFSRGINTGGDWWFLYMLPDGYIQPYVYEGSGANWASQTSGKMRDPAAWYHVVCRMDTTQASSSDRLRMYINGVLDTWGSQNQPNQNTDTEINTTSVHYFGRAGHSGQRGDFYLAEIHFLDGQSLDASNFGKTNGVTGQWVPKQYAGGNYGTNGFYLNFSDNSSTSALGTDSSGQGNNWSTSNFSVTAGVTNDVFTDTPTNNFCTMNSIVPASAKAGTLTNGNLEQAGTDHALQKATWHFGPGSITTGKWMWEINDVASSGNGQYGKYAGVTSNLTQDGGEIASTADKSWASTTTAFCKDYTATSSVATGTGSITSDNHESPGVMTFALDLDAQTLKYYYNGTLLRTDSTIPDPAVTEFVPFAFSTNSGASYDWTTSHWNFGQRAFSHEQTGYKSLCTANLPEPTIKNPSKYFNTGTYTGTGSSNAITGLGFQPDKVVVKMRNTANQDFQVFDDVRSSLKVLRWNTQEAEGTQTTRLTSLDSDGFTVGTENITNQSSKNFVYWAWKESATAGFDMVTYTGDGSTPRNISHSLGAVPELMIIKCLSDDSTRWIVYNKTMDADENMFLNSTDDDENTNNYWASTRPTSSVFTVMDGSEVNGNSRTYINYLWASVAGMCKVGTYTGNDANDGAFLHLGFRPSFFLVKNTNDNEAWALYDDARGFNDNNPYIVPSGYNNMVELTDLDLDFNSNGIKFRVGHNRVNYSENTSAYIYLAMARSPFKYANAR